MSRNVPTQEDIEQFSDLPMPAKGERQSSFDLIEDDSSLTSVGHVTTDGSEDGEVECPCGRTQVKKDVIRY